MKSIFPAGTGLHARLLVMLLAFGAIPLGVAMSVGYFFSRKAILNQSALALREYGMLQTDHFRTELSRQRLLLRTITGQLNGSLATRDSLALAAILQNSLADDGVFDGLRLVSAGGATMAEVALRDAAPHWPDSAPATDWRTTPIWMHRDGNRAIAYLISQPATTSGGTFWLEGHVRVSDFQRLFNITAHPLGGVEQGILDQLGHVIVVPHAHSAGQLGPIAALSDSLLVSRWDLEESAALTLTAPVSDTPWILAAYLPLSIALAPLRSVAEVAIVSYAVLLALIILAAATAATTIADPLKNLANIALDLGQTGEYRPAKPSAVRETNVLIESFDNMAGDLARSRKEIQQLHDRELERAQQLASVGELASGVAHEIRNPLTGVLGAIDMAVDTLSDGDTARPLLIESRQQLRRIESATTQLLQYARPPELKAVDVEANLLAERAATIVRPRAGAANVKLAVTPAPDTPVVHVDPELIVQVLVNLLLNSVQAIHGEGDVAIETSASDTGVNITVFDSGPGISDEASNDIFRPFFTTRNQGTGLGLSISKQIIERHGGTLELVESSLGGAGFRVTLPRQQGEVT